MPVSKTVFVDRNFNLPNLFKFLKYSLLAYFIIWFIMASKQVNNQDFKIFFSEHKWARLSVVFLIIFFSLDFEGESALMLRIVSAIIVTFAYYITVEGEV